MEMGKLFDNCHHLFTDNLFATYAAANYLLERGTFMTGTMRRNQLQHIPNEIVTAKPSQRWEKRFITGRRDTLPCHIDKSNLRTSLLLCYQIFVGHLMFHIGKRLTNNSSNSRYVQPKYGGVDSSDQVMYSYIYDRKSKSWSKKVAFNLLSRLLMNWYILYKQTVRNPKSRLEFIQDIIDSLASESKAIVGDLIQPPSSN